MKGRLMVVGALALGWLLLAGDRAVAQPSRNFPGGRIHLPGSPTVGFPPANTRTRQAANQIGQASTDFYAKNGYPKVLGDAVEQGSAGGGGAGGSAGGSLSGGISGGASGGINGSGFQGNTGNQIGSQSGGTIFGGIFGFVAPRGAGLTGGGFTGAVPKGFGFGGTPDLARPNSPLNGAVNR